MISMPAVFSSKNMPLYSFVKTRTFSPRFPKYCCSLIVSGPSWAKAPTADRQKAIERIETTRVVHTGRSPTECLVMISSVHG
jgi:hypothetical protein